MAAILLALILLTINVHAQNIQQTDTRSLIDIEKAYDHYEDSMDQLPAYGNDSAMRILSVIQGKSLKLEGLKMILANRLDTTNMRETLPGYMGMVEMLLANTKENAGKLNLRYLMGLEVVVNTMKSNAADYSKELAENTERLKDVENTLTAFKPDTVLSKSLDTSRAMQSLKRESIKLNASISEIEQHYKEQRLILSKYQANVQNLLIRLAELNNLLYVQKKLVVNTFWDKEINAVWDSRNYDNTKWRQQLSNSNALNIKVMSSFISKSTEQILKLLAVILLVFLGAYFFLKKSTRKNHQDTIIQKRVTYFSRYPLFSSIILIMPFSYLFFSNMPVPIVAMLTLIMIVCSMPLATLRFSNKMDIAFLAILPLYLFLSYIRLNWETVYTLRWLVLLSNLFAVALGVYIWWKAKLERFVEGDDKLHIILRFLAGFMIVACGLAFVANLFGMYRLSKVYGTTGVVGFYRGISLYFFVQVAMEAIYLLLEASKPKNENATSVTDYRELQNKIKAVLYVLSFLVWLYFTLYYIGWIDPVINGLTDFFKTPRKVGDVTFSYGSIFLFIGILLLSAFLANTIAYFTSLREQQTNTSRKKGLGSSILLIRLAILTGGFLLALAATKIPIDRITIVLGALSVGIGFGLQNIIENLVSGVILAFEKPIQIGDQIEVGDKAGTVKEIGIRSSRIRAGSGADIVIPNGSLISQGLINWTLKDTTRKIELIIGVSNDSDAAKAKALLDDIVSQDSFVKHPAPRVWFHDFGKTSIDIKVQFWVKHLDEGTPKKSELIAQTIKVFNENGIKLSEKG
jgi:small-conductance mechanosensitive channel